MVGSNGVNGNGPSARVGTDTVKQGLAQMLKGGVIVSNIVWIVLDCGRANANFLEKII